MNRKQTKRILLLGCGITMCALVGLAADKEAAAPKSEGKAAVPEMVATVVSIGGAPVLSLQLPKDSVLKTKGDRIDVGAKSAHLFFQLWLADKAKTIDDAVGMMDGLLKKEDVKDLVFSTTNSITVAGSPAKEFAGAGTEVDDGDPGRAVVFVFSVDGKIFIACIHGEHWTDADLVTLRTALQTAKKP